MKSLLLLYSLSLCLFESINAMEVPRAPSRNACTLDISSYNLDKNTQHFLLTTLKRHTQGSATHWPGVLSTITQRVEQNTFLCKKDCEKKSAELFVFLLFNVFGHILDFYKSGNAIMQATNVSLGLCNTIQAADTFYAWHSLSKRKLLDPLLANSAKANAYILLFNVMYQFMCHWFGADASQAHLMMSGINLLALYVAHSFCKEFKSNNAAIKSLERAITDIKNFNEQEATE